MNGKITEEIPYGFMRHEKYDVVVMDSEKMESVKLMFRLCLEFMDLLKYQMSSKATMEQLFFITCDDRNDR